MSDETQQPQQPTPTTPLSAPTTGQPAPTVIRKRSSHRHHRHKARRRPGMTEYQKRRTLNLLVFAYAAPTLLAFIGGFILAWVHTKYDPSMRPEKLGSLGWQMLIVGLGVFLIALIIDWTRRALNFLRERREQAEIDRQSGRRRSSHRRHRHHHG